MKTVHLASEAALRSSLGPRLCILCGERVSMNTNDYVIVAEDRMPDEIWCLPDHPLLVVHQVMKS